MKPVIYYVATSLDGFIAHPDGSFGGFPWDDAYGADLLARYPETFPAHLRPPTASAVDNRLFDTVLMGRKTYEVGSTAGVTNPYPTLQQYVFSRSMVERPDARVDLVNADAAERVRALRTGTGKAIWLCGGGELASTLLDADLIDEVIVKLNPVVFGAGIPLFSREVAPRQLALVDQHTYASGHALLHYRVKRPA